MTKENSSKTHPPKPEANGGQYFTGYGWAVPVKLGEWEWSTDLGKWGRHVEFDTGWSGYTYPRTYGD